MTGQEILVVGVDGSDASARALSWALHEGKRWCAPVHAIMAWESDAVVSGPGPLLMYPELAPHRVRERHRRDLVRVVRGCLGGSTTPEVHTELVEGAAADVLTERSAHAAMLVLGDHGHRLVAEAVLGSTVLRCIRKARCPVVVIPREMPMRPEQDEPRTEAGDPVLG